MAQFRTAQWLGLWPDQGNSHLGVELKAIEATHQIGELGIVEGQ
jgi:hypothetical protein